MSVASQDNATRTGVFARAAIYAVLVVFAVGALLYTPFAWWMNRQFSLRGVKTGTGRFGSPSP